VVYAVPGDPQVGEATVGLIRALAAEQNAPLTIIAGISFIEPTLAALGLDALDGVQIIDAVDVARLHHPPLNPDAPALLAQVYSPAVASDVKLTLSNQYPDEHVVTLVHGAGTPDARLERVPLHGMDRSPHISHLTSLFVPPLGRRGSFEYFQEIVAHLRAPEGCPWDRKQTHQSLRPYLLEETYEVLEKLDADDTDGLYKEMGDLLLQIVLHTQIATEHGEFQMGDLIAHVTEKMIRRHPHVWGDVQVSGAEQVHQNWDQIKKQENAANGSADAEPPSALDGVPEALPALAQAYNYHVRAARTGFEWDTFEDVVAKLREEVDELLAAEDDAHRAEEMGDVLTVAVNVARWLKIDPETALRNSNRKFSRRFRAIERLAHAQGRTLQSMTLAEMEILWAQVKGEERNGER
ncbi:MAG: nucleoside triphosphate pyrophosphohydrolase, partial [Acidobacteria bacterium]|nr:nucleoside triphosphate pyrophosphohydrolase [Acidobacteriota bacterium]